MVAAHDHKLPRKGGGGNQFFQHFVGQSFADRPATVLITHSMAFLVILLALVSREFIQTRKKRQHEAAN